jgi:hypothetical protein
MLGSGGFADVYLYNQVLPSREVAVKVLHAGVTERTAGNFTAEANVMAQLSTHPSIVTILQAAIAPDGRPYLVMEYYPRPNLSVRSKNRPLSVPDALDVVIRIAGAVETAHRAGIIHRDIKPANILTSAYGRPGLTDFGISAAKSDVADRESGLSVPWCAREVILGTSNGDERSDVYSLTATLHSLLAGRSPFEIPDQRNSAVDLMARITNGQPPQLERADVPLGLRRVIAMGLDPDPENRPQSAAAFARLLQEVEVQLHLAVTPLDVLSDGVEHEEYGPEDEGETRIRGATVVRPSKAPAEPTASVIEGIPATPPRPAAAPAVAPRSWPGAPEVADTVLRDGGTPATGDGSAPQGPPAAGSPPRRSVPIIAAGAVVAALAAVAVGVGLTGGGDGGPTEQEPTVDQDAVVVAVPSPTDLAIVRTGETTAQATWTVPEPLPGDRFQWQRTDSGSAAGTTDTPALTLEGLAPTDRPCLDIWTVRSTGQRSETPAKACAGA